jgi:hypothetical protein
MQGVDDPSTMVSMYTASFVFTKLWPRKRAISKPQPRTTAGSPDACPRR